MEIVSISETPNHNTMKITLNESREDMKSNTYTELKKDNLNLSMHYSISTV